MADQPNAQQQEAPPPWTVPSSAKLSKDELRTRRAGVTNALATVERIQSRIPSWQRFVASTETDAKNTPPDWQSIAQRFAGYTDRPDESFDGNQPQEMLDTIAGRDKATKSQGDGLTFGALLGIHAELLIVRLEEAQSSWDSAQAHAKATADATTSAAAAGVPAAAQPASPAAQPDPAAAQPDPAAAQAASAAAQAASAAAQATSTATQPELAAAHAASAAAHAASAVAHAASATTQPATAAAQPASAQAFQSDLDRLKAALDGAMQHSLFLTFLSTINNDHVGDSLTVDDHCAGWGLNSTQIDMVWQWLTTDPHVFGAQPLDIAVDKAHRCAYRESSTFWQRWWYASALLWGAALTYGVVVGLFVILHVAGVWHYSASWALKLLVLMLFVSIGAWAHVGAKIVNVNYDNPMSVYSAKSKLDWLALYWLAVLQMYIPVGVVVSSLWGAGNVPTSFQKLGTALLAGYGADSFVGAALSKAKSSSSRAATGNQPTTAPAASATGAAKQQTPTKA
jgi:chemotaxis protein histidine kinase CheA